MLVGHHPAETAALVRDEHQPGVLVGTQPREVDRRRVGERIVIGDDADIQITVVSIRGNHVRLGITALRSKYFSQFATNGSKSGNSG